MALKIFKSGSLVAVRDDRNKPEYTRYYNSQLTHFAYNESKEHFYIYARQTSNDPLQHWEYPVSQIQQENGLPFSNDGELIDYLSSILGSNLNNTGTPVFFNATNQQINTAGQTYAVIGIRVNSALADYKDILVKNISLLSRNNDDNTWVLCLNPTISNQPLTWGDTDGFGSYTNTSLQVSIGEDGAAGGSNIISDLGNRIGSGSNSGNFGRVFEISHQLRLNVGDELWVGVRAATTNLDLDCSINLEEQL